MRKFNTRNIKRNDKRYHQNSIIFCQKILFAKIIVVAHNQMQQFISGAKTYFSNAMF